MQIINFLDPNHPDDLGISTMFFPGGEPHVKISTIEDEKVQINYNATSWEDFGLLICLLNALQHQDKTIHLFMPYFPGARQDRNPDGNTPLTVEIYAEILSPYVSHLIIADIHSDLALSIITQYFRSVERISVRDIFTEYKSHFHHIDYIIAPDKGAIGRATEAADVLGVPVIQCEKVRDFNTGNITGYEILGDILPGEYLVVDDICDGGATFNILGESFYDILHKIGGEDVVESYGLHLYVTHPIFSKGFDDILDNYQRIYTTNSLDLYYEDYVDYITVFSLFNNRSINVD